MSTPPPDILSEGDTLVVEAMTAEQALSEVAARLGADAEIVSVEKVQRGGIGGFFARELVQIQARRPHTAAQGTATANQRRESAEEGPMQGQGQGQAQGQGETHGQGQEESALQRVLAALASDANSQERTFQEALRSELADNDIPGLNGIPGLNDIPGLTGVPGLPDTAGAPPPRIIGPAARAAAAADAAAGAATSAHASAAEEADGEEEDDDSGAEPRTSVRPPDNPEFLQLIRETETPVQHEPVAQPAQPQVTFGTETREAPEPQAAAPDTQPARSPSLHTMVTPGMPEWSVENLQRLRLPNLILDAVRDLDPRDDLAWVHAIGSAVAALCRPLPAGDAAYVGPKAAKIGEPIDLPIIEFTRRAPKKGDVCVPLTDTQEHRDWLAWALGDRWLHVVIGGARWRDFLFDEPLAISWVSDADLPDAISLCADLGLVLAYHPGPRGRGPQRANPVDVAVALRGMMPRR